MSGRFGVGRFLVLAELPPFFFGGVGVRGGEQQVAEHEERQEDAAGDGHVLDGGQACPAFRLARRVALREPTGDVRLGEGRAGRGRHLGADVLGPGAGRQDRGHHVGQLGGGLETLLGPLGEQAAHDLRHRGRHALTPLLHGRRVLGGVLAQPGHPVAFVEGGLPCQQEVKRAAQAVQVRANVDLLGIERLFGGNVVGGADQGAAAHARIAARTLQVRQAEIEDLGPAVRRGLRQGQARTHTRADAARRTVAARFCLRLVLCQQQIGRLDVTMHQAGVGDRLQPMRDLPDQVTGLGDR